MQDSAAKLLQAGRLILEAPRFGVSKQYIRPTENLVFGALEKTHLNDNWPIFYIGAVR